MRNLSKRSRKAFTLTELLIVVLVLGVLATVATPKMKKMLETRKTTEAENMLAAVRMEQEKRCTLGKNYHTDPEKVSVMASAENSKNYNYSLTSKGAVASSASQNYSIEIMSYKDGSMCCRGEYCGNLNKDYRRCPNSVNIEDECMTPISCGASESLSRACPSPAVGTQSRTADCDTNVGKWEYGSWTGTCNCDDSTKVDTRACPQGVGTQTRTATCDSSTYTWQYGEWTGTCSCDDSTKVDTRACPQGTGTQTRTATCDSSTYTWQYGEWTGACACDTSTKPEKEVADCGSEICGKKTRDYSCDTSTGAWIAAAWDTSSCEALPASEEVVCNVCGTKTVTYSCNPNYDPDAFKVQNEFVDVIKVGALRISALPSGLPDNLLNSFANKFSGFSKFVSTSTKCSVSDSSTCPEPPECNPGDYDKSNCRVCSSAGKWVQVSCPEPEIGGTPLNAGGCIEIDKLDGSGCVLEERGSNGAHYWYNCPGTRNDNIWGDTVAFHMPPC